MRVRVKGAGGKSKSKGEGKSKSKGTGKGKVHPHFHPHSHHHSHRHLHPCLRDTCQVIGYGAGTFLPGLFIQQLAANGVAEIEALHWGWRLVLFWAGWGIMFLMLALRSTMKNQKVDVEMALPLSEVVVQVDHKFHTSPRATNDT